MEKSVTPLVRQERTVKTGKEMAQELCDFVNNMGADVEGFVEELTRYQHRTLQQNCMRLFMQCVKEWAKKHTNEYDLRNEATVEVSQKINAMVPEIDYIPFI